eukprot:CAMPEP_0202475858 /NCGR_PEP_ID=MMETSP1360-20130828/93120_1 /ASSEMBLY_ACC=CAM_ASM_000848 /TAXON_ID=515479 /ORGANISM="Licmophora paradoxa, Strain CCMP2313" /LENGTH=228 /DNA_ID=CAMNT_0049103039 /DNA_START=417 /DNA_END=1103 /DNA_ORIENTATION=-
MSTITDFSPHISAYNFIANHISTSHISTSHITVTSAPVTSAPVTSAPVTGAPVASAPVTSAPVTSAPVTRAPVTSAPVTSAPVTRAPVTKSPTTRPSPLPTPRPTPVKDKQVTLVVVFGEKPENVTAIIKTEVVVSEEPEILLLKSFDGVYALTNYTKTVDVASGVLYRIEIRQEGKEGLNSFELCRGTNAGKNDENLIFRDSTPSIFNGNYFIIEKNETEKNETLST